MKAYEKCVCILKQVKKGFSADGSALSGYLTAERMGKSLTVTVRLPSAAPVSDGRYVLVLRLGGTDRIGELRGEPLTFEADSLAGGLAALVLFTRAEAEPVAFGTTNGTPSYLPLLSAFERSESEKKAPMSANAVKKITESTEKSAVAAEAPPFRGPYDDEAIAADNYFRSQGPHDGDGQAQSGKEAEGDGKTGEAPAGGDDGAVHPFGGAPLAFYESVREKLALLFERYPADDRLRTAFPHSRWARADDTLIGILYEEGRPRFLCIAKEGSARPADMPASLFVPETPYSDEKGFYVLFQSADTGEIVTVGEG